MGAEVIVVQEIQMPSVWGAVKDFRASVNYDFLSGWTATFSRPKPLEHRRKIEGTNGKG